MRRALAPVALSSVLLAGCVMSGVVKHQFLGMYPADQPSAAPVAVLDPYPGVPFRVQVNCDDKLSSFMLSPLLPLPPVIPAGIFESGDEHRVYVSVSEATGVSYEPLQAALALRKEIYKPVPVQLLDDDGTPVQLMGDEWRADAEGAGGGVMMLAFDANCGDLDKGSLVIAPVTYTTVHHPSVTLLLKYSYAKESDFGYMR